MSKTDTVRPAGGIQVNERTLRGWRWDGPTELVSRPVRCRREDWYIARATLTQGASLARAEVLIRFLRGEELIEQRCLRLHATSQNGRTGELFGWVQTPENATHLQLCLPDATLTGQVTRIVLEDVAERDPKCHPLANVPRWSSYRPPFPLERLILPGRLSDLAGVLRDPGLTVVNAPSHWSELREIAPGSVCIIDPLWIKLWKLKLADVEALAEDAWVIVDLETAATLLKRARAVSCELVTHVSPSGLMSARCEYADVPTRGLALQDVVPYGTMNEKGEFVMRGIRASRAWKRYADAAGFATLLSGETPWSDRNADVLSAARPVGKGELLATDLPWLVNGDFGHPVAPRLARHLLRMHVGCSIPDHIQYWNRWDSGEVVVRDISDLTRRYAPLRTMRWASDDSQCAHLGLSIMPAEPVERYIMFATGRIDSVGIHNGLPPEPLMVFCKWLAREVQERTSWVRRHLTGTLVTWQFDTRDGLKYAANFASADGVSAKTPRVIHLRRTAASGSEIPDDAELIRFPEDEGLHGDGALDYQDKLTRLLRKLLARR